MNENPRDTQKRILRVWESNVCQGLTGLPVGTTVVDYEFGIDFDYWALDRGEVRLCMQDDSTAPVAIVVFYAPGMALKVEDLWIDIPKPDALDLSIPAYDDPAWAPGDSALVTTGLTMDELLKRGEEMPPADKVDLALVLARQATDSGNRTRLEDVPKVIKEIRNLRPPSTEHLRVLEREEFPLIEKEMPPLDDGINTGYSRFGKGPFQPPQSGMLRMPLTRRPNEEKLLSGPDAEYSPGAEYTISKGPYPPPPNRLTETRLDLMTSDVGNTQPKQTNPPLPTPVDPYEQAGPVTGRGNLGNPVGMTLQFDGPMAGLPVVEQGKHEKGDVA